MQRVAGGGAIATETEGQSRARPASVGSKAAWSPALLRALASGYLQARCVGSNCRLLCFEWSE